MTTARRIETLEQLVETATAASDTTKRYGLTLYSHMEYDDPVAGAEWEKKDNEIPYPFSREYRNADGTTNEAYEKAMDTYRTLKAAHREIRPQKHEEKAYSLRSGRYYQLDLSTALGEAVERVWTRRKSKRGVQQLVGTLTLAGILKRLGQTDIGQKVDAAKAAVEATRGRNKRNYLRATVTEALTTLRKAIAAANAGGVSLLDVTIGFDESALQLEANPKEEK